MKEYNLLLKQAEALINSENNLISLLSNSSSFIYHAIDNLNWVGYYLVTGDILTVGPFQGKLACSEIKLGDGVCGSAWEENQVIVVDDVTKHPNHIVCDSDSRSEIVIPITVDNLVIAVFDIDSPVLSRFDNDLRDFLIAYNEIVTNRISELSY